MARKKKYSLFFGITSRVLLSIFAILLIISYLSIYVNPAKAWFMTIFGLLFIPLVLCNAVLLAWAVIRRSGTAVIPLLALMPLLFMSGKLFRFAGEEHADAEGLKVISYNVGGFASWQDGGFSSARECADSIFAFLRAENPDIICLQEVKVENPDVLKSYISRRMPGYDVKYYVNANSRRSYGNVTLCRYPAIDKGRITFENSYNKALYSDYCIDGDTVRVYNCHFQSYNISPTRLAAMLRKDYRRAVTQTEAKMKHSITLRPKQVEQVLEHIEKCSEKVIVAGDFNDTPMSYTYWRLARKRKDSFREAGHGSGATFSLLRPFLRIDYILFPEEYNALKHKVIHKKFSDHYPIETIMEKI